MRKIALAHETNGTNETSIKTRMVDRIWYMPFDSIDLLSAYDPLDTVKSVANA